MSENELENGITAVDAGGAVALDDGCCPERGAAAPGHPKKATGGVRQAVILSEATVGSEVEGSRAAPAESVREYEPLAVEGRLGYHFVKRAFDIVFSACATIVGLIPVALLCLVIRLESPGSPIYLQERVGYRGKPLRILKLRTMVADSDDVEKHLSPEQLTQWERERKVDDDPRVTKVGRFLRKTSLASVIIGTPGDGESTKSLSRSANSSLDLQLCERRPGLCCFARTQYKRFQFLSVVVFRDARGVFNRTFTRISSLVPSAPLRGYAEGCSSFLSISKAVRCNDGGECCRRVA